MSEDIRGSGNLAYEPPTEEVKDSLGPLGVLACMLLVAMLCFAIGVVVIQPAAPDPPPCQQLTPDPLSPVVPA